MATCGKVIALIPLLAFATTARTARAQTISGPRASETNVDIGVLVARETPPALFPDDGFNLGTAITAKTPCLDSIQSTLGASLEAGAGPAPSTVRSSGCQTRKSPATPPQFNLWPSGSCGASLSLSISTACFARPVLGLSVWNNRIFSEDAIPLLFAPPKREKFHLGPALVQSLEFLLMEHGFRLASDPYARYLLFHKPFWKDYLSSAEHFDMSRWGDGDDFLVNYIGHPLEGSVSGNIFIQNDPKGRSAKFGRSSEYWQSRFKALAWSAVYSAYFEIGPILSETALGNEGGYTYVPGCGFYPTCQKEPGRTYKPPTNNTGWVDFIVTPTVGMGWSILEDFLDVALVDRLAGGDNSLKIRILRGAITPSRSLANMLAGAPPWRRFNGSHETIEAFGSPLKAQSKWQEWKNDPRFDVGVHMTSASFPMDWEGCSSCRVFARGVGLDLGYRLTRILYLDSEFNLFPGSGGSAGRGAAEEGLFGVRVGHTTRSWGIFAQMRPGFVRFDKTLVAGTSSQFDPATRFAFDFGGSVEYYASRHSTIRFNMGTTLVHYLSGHPDPQQPPVSVLSNSYYTTQGSFRLTSGYIFRF